MSRPSIPSRFRPPPRSAPFAPGRYLTDGVRLFRVVSGFTRRTDDVSAWLENCYTLEIESYSPDELYGMGLRLVRRSELTPF